MFPCSFRDLLTYRPATHSICNEMCTCNNAGVPTLGQRGGCISTTSFIQIVTLISLLPWTIAQMCSCDNAGVASPGQNTYTCTSGPPVVPDQFSCGLGAACVAAGSFDLSTPETDICTETCVEVELRVGTSWDNSKTVTASTNLICPATVSQANWLSAYTSSAKFAVQTSGLQVSVQRTDIHEGWTFDLRFQCCQSQRYRVRCRTGSPADCSIRVYDLGADPCSAYSPCGLLLVANGSYINSKDDFNSCPLGWKLVAPRSLQDWTAVRNSFDDFPGVRIADVTKPTSGSDGSSAPMNSASRSQWVTADGHAWYLRGTSYTEPSGDYTENCYLGFDNWNLPNLALGDQLTFNDAGCSYGATTYLCQPDGSTPAVVISCICPNGTPTVASGSGGTLCERTWVDCSSCESGFALSAPAGLGSQTCQSVNPAFCCQGSPARCSISLYNLGADACLAYSPCGLLQVNNGRYINNKDDVNSCPLGWKLFAPRSLKDWKTVKAMVLDDYRWVVDVTKSTGGSDGSSQPMNSASRPQWVTSDGAGWWLRSTSYSEPNGDYTANCYLILWYLPDFAAGGELLFNDEDCGDLGGRKYLCQPDRSAAVSCICPHGTPTSTSGAGGTLCERTWVDCSSCDSGYTLSAPAGLGSQICKRTGNCVDTPSWSNGVQQTCASYITYGWCRNGAAVPGLEWTLGAGFLYPEENCCACGKPGASCNPGFHKSNMSCVPNVCQCDGGVPVTGVACTSDGANMCSSCNPGFHKSNINCVPNVCQCDGGVPVTGVACTSDGANMCSSCNPGFHKSNINCVPNVCQCNGGVPVTGVACTSDGANMCSSCNPGFHKSNINCVPNVCQCDGGVPVTGVACTSDGANMCSSCNPGFHKSNMNCVPNVCQCNGGVPVTGSACSSDGANMCSSCRVGYHITLGSNGTRQTCETSSGMPSPGASPVPSANSSPALGASPVPSANSSPALGASPVPSAISSPALAASPVPSAISSPALAASPVPSANSSPALAASPVPSAISSPALGASPVPSLSSSPALGALAEPLPASKSPAPLMVQQLRPTPKSLMWAFNTLLLLITALMITLLLVFWRTRTLQVLSPPKVLVFMTGCAVGLCGAYFLAFRNSAVVCPAYLYTRYVGFSLISSPLIVTHRLLLSAIAESAQGSYKPAWSLQRSYLELGGLLLVELCILVATATMQGLGYWVWEQDPSGRCPANRPYLLLTAVYMAMLGVCSFYAFRVRKAPGIFNDAKETGLVAYNTLVLSSISVCLQGVQDTSNGWLLAQAMITYASFFGSLCIFFVPRLFMLKEELASLHVRTRVRQMVPGPRLESADASGTPGPSPAQQIVPALSQHESSAASNHRSTQHDGSSAVSEVHVEQRSGNCVQTKQGNQKQESGPPQAETTVRVHNAGQTVAQQMGDALSHPAIQMTEYASPSVRRAEASKNGLSLVPEQSNSYTGVGMMIELSRVMHNSSFFETKSEIHANTIQDSHVDFVSTDPDPSDVHDVESSQADSEVNSNDITKAKQQQATMMTTETPETLLQSHSVELGPRTSSFGTDPRYFPPLQTVLPRVSLP
eukprot:g81599.t1